MCYSSVCQNDLCDMLEMTPQIILNILPVHLCSIEEALADTLVESDCNGNSPPLESRTTTPISSRFG